MAAETAFVRRRWRHWHGSPDDIVRIAQRMEALLAAAGMNDSNVRITVERKTGATAYESAAEAAEGLPEADLSRLEDISLSGGSLGPLTTYVFFFRHSTVLKVEASGDHHIQAAGIGADIAAEIERGSRSVPHQNAIIVGLIVASLLLLGGTVVPGRSATLAQVLAAVALLPSLAALWLGVFRPIFVPAREIVPEGQPSRADRWGRPLLKMGAWLLTLVLGAILGVIFTERLD